MDSRRHLAAVFHQFGLTDALVPATGAGEHIRQYGRAPEYNSPEWWDRKALENRMAAITTKYVGHKGDFVLLARMLLNEVNKHNELTSRLEENEPPNE